MSRRLLLKDSESGGSTKQPFLHPLPQAHSLVRVPAVVARYLGDADMTQKVTDAVRVHQDSFTAIDFATAFAEILRRVILGANVAQALKWGAFEKSPPLYDDQRVYVQARRSQIPTVAPCLSLAPSLRLLNLLRC